MKTLSALFFLSVFFISGCQSILRQSDTLSCPGERLPADSSCSSMFKTATSILDAKTTSINTEVKGTLVEIQLPTPSDMKRFFEEMNDFKTLHDDNHGKRDYSILTELQYYFEQVYTKYHEDGDKLVILGKVLLERKRHGESTTEILTELGFYESDRHLLPPNDLASLYSKLYSKLSQAAASSGLKQSDIIWPALLFVRPSTEKSGELERIFVRPGIDPLPAKNKNWRLQTHNTEFEPPQFEKMILGKRLLLSGEMFFHDINHVIDFIERPHYMSAYLNFIAQRKIFNSRTKKMSSSKIEILYGKIQSALNSDLMINETLFLPSKKNLSVINGTLLSPPMNQIESLSQIRDRYKNLSEDQLIDKAADFSDKMNILFSRFGGGARDFFVERYETEYLTEKGLQDFESGTVAEMHDISRQLLYLQNESAGMFQRLEVLRKYISDPQSSPWRFRSFLERKSAERSVDSREFTKQLLARQLAEIDFRIRSALFYAITPEKLVADLTLLTRENGWRDYKKSATYLFYSTYPVGSYQWKTFVDILP